MVIVFIIVCAFILLDMITGIIKAFKEKNFTSSVMREGLLHKCAELICIAFGALVDFAQGSMDLGVNIPVASSICIYICLMEIGSIVENLCAINPNLLPDKIKQHFQKLNFK